MLHDIGRLLTHPAVAAQVDALRLMDHGLKHREIVPALAAAGPAPADSGCGVRPLLHDTTDGAEHAVHGIAQVLSAVRGDEDEA